jgi:hypothetical protein
MFGVVFAEHLSFQSGLKTQMILGHFLTILAGLSFAVSPNNTFFILLAVVFWV